MNLINFTIHSRDYNAYSSYVIDSFVAWEQTSSTGFLTGEINDES